MDSNGIPTLKIFDSARRKFNLEDGEEVIDLSGIPPPRSATPPLILDGYEEEVQIITQEEFLAAIDQRLEKELTAYLNLERHLWRNFNPSW